MYVELNELVQRVNAEKGRKGEEYVLCCVYINGKMAAAVAAAFIFGYSFFLSFH